MGPSDLTYSSTIKYLGVTFDHKLSFKDHLANKVKEAKISLLKLNSAIGKKWGPSPHLPQWAYKIITLSKLSYGSIVWGNRPLTKKQKLTLRRINRLAGMAITSAFPNSPTSGLEIICNILPIPLLLEKTGLTRFLKIRQTLRITWDGLVPPRFHPHRRTWIKLASQLNPECLQPHDSISTRYHNRTFHISLELIRSNPSLQNISIFTDGSHINDNTGCGIAFYNGDTLLTQLSYKLSPFNTVSQAEISAILQAGKHCIRQKFRDKHITIYSDSFSTIQALHSYKITSSLILKTIYIWNSIGALNSVSIRWVKAHAGFHGNETADHLAKQGALSLQDPLPSVTPFSHIKSSIHKHTTDRWLHEWSTRRDCRQTRLWFPTPDYAKSLQIINQPKSVTSLLTQFITSFSNLGYHSLNKGEISPTEALCRLCSESTETVWHLCTECPSLAVKSLEIFGPEGPQDGHWTVSQLLCFINIPRLQTLLIERIQTN